MRKFQAIEPSRELIRQVVGEQGGTQPRIDFVRQAERGIKGPGGKLGVFASAFDPLTRAHLEIIRRAEQKVDELLLLADRQNADKQTSFASLEDRLYMLLEFFRDQEKVSLGLASHPLFLDKLRALKHAYPPGTSFYFLVGYDTAVRILDRKYYQDGEAALEELFRDSQFLVAPRAGRSEEELTQLFQTPENKKFRERVHHLGISDFASSLSSTLAREKLRRGEDVRDLVPEQILKLIKELKLYGG